MWRPGGLPKLIVMSHNTWMHRGVRVAIRPLVASPITPNQVTTPRLAVGLAAALALAHGEETWHDRGAGLFILSFFLDRRTASWRA